MRLRRQADIKLLELPSIKDSEAPEPDDSVEVRLQRYFKAVTDKAQEVDTWYLSDRRRKRAASRCLRAAAILLISAGGIWPIVVGPVGRGWDPSWGYVCLAVAGAFVAFDRFFGLSSAWKRDIATHDQLCVRYTRFLFDWAALSMPISGSVVENQLGRLHLLDGITNDIVALVAHETALWTDEFTQLSDSLSRSVASVGVDEPEERKAS